MLDWSKPVQRTPEVQRAAESAPTVEREAARLPARSDFVQVLRWDFRLSFPEPLQEAIEAGKLFEEDASPDNLKALHEEHTKHALSILSDLDALLDARRRGVDPRTGRVPRTAKQREALEVRFRDEPARLEHAFDVLMDVYEEAFGAEAVVAFKKAIRAWHAGVQVVAEHPPWARPLAPAIQSAVFGNEEDGSPVTPGQEELLAITDAVAEEFLELTNGNERRQLLEKYAEDFGQAAADRLSVWARSKRLADEGSEAIWHPGHPWHYYSEGDGAEPIPVAEIPAAEIDDASLGIALPKDAKRRSTKLSQILTDQERQLADDERRYTELVEGGIAALTDHDRSVSNNDNDEIDWASAIALKYNQIRLGRGRLQLLRGKLG